MRKAIFDGRERRCYVRVDTLLPVRFRLCGPDSAKIYSGATKNVSQGGLCLEVLRDQGELIETVSSTGQWPSVEVELSLPDNQGEPSIQLDWIASRLDWAKKPNTQNPTLLMGMVFVDMHEEVRRLIFEFVLGQFLKGYRPESRARSPVYAIR